MGRHLWLTQMVQSNLHFAPAKLNRRIKTSCSHDKFWMWYTSKPFSKMWLVAIPHEFSLKRRLQHLLWDCPVLVDVAGMLLCFKLQHWAEMSQSGTLTVQEVADSQLGVGWSVRAQTFWTLSTTEGTTETSWAWCVSLGSDYLSSSKLMWACHLLSLCLQLWKFKCPQAGTK